jgi:hypothetical protein
LWADGAGEGALIGMDALSEAYLATAIVLVAVMTYSGGPKQTVSASLRQFGPVGVLARSPSTIRIKTGPL